MSTKVHSNATYLCALAAICNVPKEVARTLATIDKDDLVSCVEFMAIMSNYKTDDKEPIDEAAVAVMSKLTKSEWIRTVSQETLYKPIFLHSQAPLAGVFGMKGKVQVDAKGVISLHHRHLHQELTDVTTAKAPFSKDNLTLIAKRAAQFAAATSQGAVMILDDDKLSLLQFLAPFVKYEVDSTGKLDIKVDPYPYKQAKWSYSYSFNPELAPIVTAGIEFNTQQPAVKAVIKQLNALNLSPPDGMPLMYYLAQVMHSKSVDIKLRMPKLPTGKKWPGLSEMPWPVIFSSETKKVVKGNYPVLADDLESTGRMTYALSAWQQSTQNALELNFLGSLANLGRTTAEALLMSEFMLKKKIKRVILTHSPTAAILKSLNKRAFDVVLVGGVCSDADVKVTSWHSVIKDIIAEPVATSPSTLWSAMPMELQTLVQELKKPVFVAFPNLESLCVDGADTHQGFYHGRAIDSIDVCPWAVRPTVVIGFGEVADCRVANKVTIDDTVRLCNALARRVFSDYSYMNFVKYPGRAPWRCPVLSQPQSIEDLDACYYKITQNTKKAKASGLALDSVLAPVFDLSTLAFEEDGAVIAFDAPDKPEAPEAAEPDVKKTKGDFAASAESASIAMDRVKEDLALAQAQVGADASRTKEARKSTDADKTLINPEGTKPMEMDE